MNKKHFSLGNPTQSLTCSSFLQKIVIVLSLSSPASAISSPPESKVFGKDHPFEIRELPAGEFRSKLETLPEQAKRRAMQWLHRFTFHEHDLRNMRIDNKGGVFFEETVTPEPIDSAPLSTSGSSGKVTTVEQAFSLHSKPGSPNILYLDFDGETLVGTAWNFHSGVSQYVAAPYDLDGNPTSFSETEVASIAEIWRRVAEDYAPFNIDITTERPEAFGPTTGTVLITRDMDLANQVMPSQGSGGVAYVGVWGRIDFPSYSPALVYFNNLGNGRPDYVAEAVSHESGHNLSLTHDGYNTEPYYHGHGSGFTSWAPIMGAGYNRHLTQWSDGSYNGGNNFQDDIGILGGKLGYQNDGNGNSAVTSTSLVVDQTGLISSTTLIDDPGNLHTDNEGVITQILERDFFYFDTTGGLAEFSVSPAFQAQYTRGANLDLGLVLFDASEAVVTSSMPQDETQASLQADLLPGRYYLAVIANGTSASLINAYGSRGQYHINGSIGVAVLDAESPTPDPMGFELPPQANDRVSITMRAMTAVDDGNGPVQYRFECTVGPSGCVSSQWQDSTLYTAKDLLPGSTYSFRVAARDENTNETAYSSSFSATTYENYPPVVINESIETLEGQSVLIDVLANDSDQDGDALTLLSFIQPANGVVEPDGDQLRYTPDDGFSGSDAFQYTVDDGFGGYVTGTVSVNVGAVNIAPVANNDSFWLYEDSSYTINVISNDTDADGDALTVLSVTQGSHGVTVLNGGSVTYTPHSNFNGADSFGYTIGDGQGGMASATVSVTVQAQNDVPLVVDDAIQTMQDVSVSFKPLSNDTDLDGDALVIVSVSSPGYGVVSFTGDTVTYTPDAGYWGSDAFSYLVRDPGGYEATGHVSVTVEQDTIEPEVINTAPVAYDDTITTKQDQNILFSVLANDLDQDGDVLQVTSVTQPANGTLVWDSSSIEYMPNAGFSGNDVFTYTVSDPAGATDQGAVYITVNATKGGGKKGGGKTTTDSGGTTSKGGGKGGKK